MSEIVVLAENLGKKYSLRHQSQQGEGFRHVLQNAVLAPFRRLGKPGTNGAPNPVSQEEFWALRDISFAIKQGEVVGIIGRNGAGKSTLLKVLSRITEPTRGRVRISGRVASLLEVGTGFHAELTGRENVYLNGTILGMTRREIRAKFDEIVAFAEVEKFLDTPVKHYSSGMYVRLAFAVAAHLEPEILIVDEVLAVGDTQFQKKCIAKMHEVSRRDGRTVLFVSHNMAAISTLTGRVILLKNGAVEYSGLPQEGINLYMSMGSSSAAVYTAPPSAVRPNITRIGLACSNPSQTQVSGQPWSITFQLHYPFSAPNACLSFQIVNQYQNSILHLNAYDDDFSICPNVGEVELRCDLGKLDLNVGSYYLMVNFSDPPGGRHFETLEYLCPFEVVAPPGADPRDWQADDCAYIETGTWSVL
jgi:lipopolysaccharide transport system ATP-binding protein